MQHSLQMNYVESHLPHLKRVSLRSYSICCTTRCHFIVSEKDETLDILFDVIYGRSNPPQTRETKREGSGRETL